jgi:histidine_hisI: phosphoribosyl-ATP diphosphatase
LLRWFTAVAMRRRRRAIPPVCWPMSRTSCSRSLPRRRARLSWLARITTTITFATRPATWSITCSWHSSATALPSTSWPANSTPAAT